MKVLKELNGKISYMKIINLKTTKEPPDLSVKPV